MNHSYRLIWSRRNHCFVAVGEHARRCGKSVRGAALVIAAALAAAVLPASLVSAGPTGGTIINGIAGDAITRPNATTTVINQASQRLAINWTSFSSAEAEKIQFVQPNASMIALNRVTGSTPSELLGNLTATGQVFVINPNGVLFGEKASVNVGGLLASTLKMESDSFLKDSQVLNVDGGAIGAVVNKGTLTANPGGYIVLAGPRVLNDSGATNEGTINAVQGTVVMAAGDKVTLTLKDDKKSLASYTIDRGSLNALVQNSGRISANGGNGEVTLTATAANDIGRAVINHTGIIEAKSLQGKPGKIRLVGKGESDMLVNGILDVSAPAGQGGLVGTHAARVNIGEKALINGKTPNEKVLEDTWTNTSTDFVIAEGKGPQTKTSIGATTLSALLSNDSQNPATPDISTGAGDLYVNASVKSESGKNLTLSASGNIYINADINAAKGVSLLLEYGQGSGTKGEIPIYSIGNGAKVYLPNGDNFSLRLGKLGLIKTYRVIGGVGETAVTELQGISNAVNNGRYVLGGDIDASATKDWNNGAGFIPLGSFEGILDGLGHTIGNLHINSTESLWVGLIRDLTPTGRIQNLTVDKANITNRGTSPTTAVGTVVGKNDGTLFNVHATTTNVVTTYNNAGGLVGVNNGEIRNSSAVGTVTFLGNNDAEATGGLVGRQVGMETSDKTKKIGGTIIDSYAAVGVTGNRSVGGLVGLMEKSSTGIANPTVTGSYAGVSADGYKGSVSGKENVGGLVGYLELGGITDSYAAVPVKGTGGNAIGGLVGLLQGVVAGTYATGSVTPGSANPATVGGLVGVNDSTNKNVLNSFWNRETTGQDSSQGSDNANGLTTAQMRTLSTFKGWTIDAEGGTGKTWRIYDGQTSPLLRSFLVTKSVEAKSVTYNSETQIGCTGTPCDSASGNTTFTPASGKNVGTYSPYDSQQRYDIRGGKLTITPFLLTPTTDAPEREYDGTRQVPARLLQVTSLRKDDVTAKYGSAEYDSKNAGDNKTVTFSGVTLENRDGASNYEIPGTFSIGNGRITPREVSLSGTTVDNKVYDGDLAAKVLDVGTLGNKVKDDVVSVSAGIAAFNDKNVGEKKDVTVSGLTLTGNDAGNYTLMNPKVTVNAAITPLTVSLLGTVVPNKVYDGGMDADVLDVGTLNKMVAGDVVIVNVSAAKFIDKNVGKKKDVTVSGLTLAGKDARNYLLDKTTVTVKADITPLTLALSGTEVAGKVYDGKTTATLTKAGTLAKGIGKDDVTLNATGASAAFADKTVGEDKVVTVSGLALQGADAGNYRIADPSAKASITARALSLSKTEIADKAYDGSTVATLTNAGTLNEVVANDDVKTTTASVTAAFADKNAGQGKAVTVSNLRLTGADAANYVLDSSVTATATIRPRPLAVRAQGVDKVYDGNANATVTLGDNRVDGDKLNLRYAKASFADSNAGSNKAVTVAGIAASGADAGNYVADTNAVTTASVSKAPLTVTANPDKKAFDGKAYRGGNGVTYAGFAAGENAAVLSGQPSYGGDAQGAVNLGTYRIAPAGYASQNYAIVYVDGKLTIQPPPLEPVYQAAGTEVAATAAAMSDAATNPDRMHLLSQQTTLQVAECGTRLPKQPVAVMVECKEGGASTNTPGSVMSAFGF
ncbi:filamentous hemagglutinin N-terminal domain-containing protein|uniref:YDG domain-containing protein n=1 Tax=Noviherbaspirillum sp. L7-7A TaxID=2850560 RepID=UPI001C2C0F6F|nr:YDG domain-containing protein [Noviherbaspirillum sp. L7-7A]MBV0880677.1 filamentous hemagglutinin N-terminal domain-containing protein [Noviherbaspirillum sp. L7-7A]